MLVEYEVFRPGIEALKIESAVAPTGEGRVRRTQLGQLAKAYAQLAGQKVRSLHGS